MISDALSRVLDGHTLRREEMGACFQQVLEGSGAPAQVAALLAALRVRGETVDELVGAAEAVRAAAVRVQAPADVVDTCGTGGDGRGTFNISTAAAIVASAGGVVVAKHGNRSVSSRCGSADVLEALGVQLDRTPEAQARSLVLSRLAFLFAPAHHPAFRHVAALRRELRVRTLFNLVGPLANPAGARRQVVGVFSEALVPKFAEALHRLGAEHALVVHGSGLDELSVVGPTLVDEVRPDGIRRHTLTPEALGLARHAPDALVGGDAQVNARLLLDVLEGVPGAPRDAVLANAGAALYVGGAAASLADGVALAREVVDSGAAFAHFERFLRAQHTSTRLDEIVSRLPAPAPAKPRRGTARGGARLREALSTGPAPRVIAEVKRRSPSAGPIADIADPAALARQYVERGARAISVLTNAADFGGSLEDLRRVRAAVDVPLLRKDFIVHPAQLDEAAEAGADAVLLIAGLLGGGLARMRAAAEARGLEALVEVHDEAELRLALDAGATLLGINNRDLRTFEVDLAVSERLAPRIPPHVLVVSESGVRSREALERLRTAGLENFLVGEFLVRGGVL